MKPFYDHRFKQWCLLYPIEDGVNGAVWGDTEEECIRKYKETIENDD